MSITRFCREEATILLNFLRPAVEEMLSLCSKSEADFSVVESAVIAAVKVIRTQLVSRGLDVSARCTSHDYICPKCGQSLTVWGLRVRKVVTAAGSGNLRAIRYRCTQCCVDYYPIIEGNSLIGGKFTLGAKERIATDAADSCFRKVSRKLPEVGIEVSAKEVDRQVREAGELLRLEQDKETELYLNNLQRKTEESFICALGSEGSSAADPVPEAMFSWAGWEGQTWAQISVDGAKARSPEMGPTGLTWFDVRTGLIRPVDEGSSALAFHTSGVMSWDRMFDRLLAVWQQRPPGLENIVFVSDDGAGIMPRAESYFQNAILIIDICHASAHVQSAALALWGPDSEQAKTIKDRSMHVLKNSNGPQDYIRQFIAAARLGPVADPKELETNVRYLWRNRHKMKYMKWHSMGLPIGSGAVESSVKQICVRRLREAGMKWTTDGADCVLQVRSACLSQTCHTVFAREQERARQAYRRFLPSDHYSQAA